jgi:hypothetical protein
VQTRPVRDPADRALRVGVAELSKEENHAERPAQGERSINHAKHDRLPRSVGPLVTQLAHRGDNVGFHQAAHFVADM